MRRDRGAPGVLLDSTEMTSDRAQAYGRVVRTVADLAASKLLPSEQDRVREAADTLFFCEDVGADAGARAALDDLEALTRHLVESGRWTEARARRLADDVGACGPLVPVA
jgi:hypothetical protein